MSNDLYSIVSRSTVRWAIHLPTESIKTFFFLTIVIKYVSGSKMKCCQFFLYIFRFYHLSCAWFVHNREYCIWCRKKIGQIFDVYVLYFVHNCIYLFCVWVYIFCLFHKGTVFLLLVFLLERGCKMQFIDETVFVNFSIQIIYFIIFSL